MALIKPVVKLILREHQNFHFEGPALALGVPEIYATAAELEDWVPRWAGRSCPPVDTPGMLSTNVIGQRLGWVSARYFFQALNLEPVTCMDIPGCEHTPDLVHDLNEPFPDDQINRYRLVVDPGTIEHVFDMRTCLSNVVRSLQLGGVVIHQVPVYMFNGGYYSLNPNLLNDFYAKNGFVDRKTYIVMWDRYHPYDGLHRCYEYTDTSMGARHALADVDQCRRSPMMLFFARKERTLPTIAIPIQFEGHYFTAGKPDRQSTAKPSLEQRISRLVTSGINHLPGTWAEPVRPRFERWKMLIKTRRQSFFL